jgi:hypothetical protein
MEMNTKGGNEIEGRFFFNYLFWGSK